MLGVRATCRGDKRTNATTLFDQLPKRFVMLNECFAHKLDEGGLCQRRILEINTMTAKIVQCSVDACDGFLGRCRVKTR